VRLRGEEGGRGGLLRVVVARAAGQWAERMAGHVGVALWVSGSSYYS
jgi:hypothetical protein